MNVYIGADHNGFDFKTQLMHMLREAGYTVVDSGNTMLDPADDFPEYTAKVVEALHADSDPDSRGILICGSGQGVCMAANRFKDMRASLCWSVELAYAARNDDNSNILCLSAHYVPFRETEEIVRMWLKTPFAGTDRFKRRITEMEQLS